MGKDSNHNPVVDDLLDSVHPWRSPGEVPIAGPKEEVSEAPCAPPPWHRPHMKGALDVHPGGVEHLRHGGGEAVGWPGVLHGCGGLVLGAVCGEEEEGKAQNAGGRVWEWMKGVRGRGT